MSKMSELYNTIHEMIASGMSKTEIKDALNVSDDIIDSIFSEESIDDYSEDDYDDSMDGDFDSAMESCGWGYDEQYNGWE